MVDAMNLSLQFIIGIVNLIPDSPLIWLFGLCIAFSIFVGIYDFARGYF